MIVLYSRLQIFNADFVEGFNVYSRCLNTSLAATNVLTVLNAGETAGYVVSGLQPFTSYSFFVIPFFKRLDGKPSNLKTIQTLEDGKRDDIFLRF